MRYRFSKFSFFRNYTTWHSSDFYGSDRAHLDTPLEMKIEKSQKKGFFWERGDPLSSFKYLVFDSKTINYMNSSIDRDGLFGTKKMGAFDSFVVECLYINVFCSLQYKGIWALIFRKYRTHSNYLKKAVDRKNMFSPSHCNLTFSFHLFYSK